MIPPDLLCILCCPESHQPLGLADAPLIEQLNQQVAAGTLKNRAGQSVAEPLEGGLLRADGQRLYPIRNQIPILLIDEAIAIANPVG